MPTPSEELAEIRATLENYSVRDYGTGQSTASLIGGLCRRVRQQNEDDQRLRDLESAMRQVKEYLDAASRAMFVSDRKRMRERLAAAYMVAEVATERR
jgi:hypothetical protein